MWRWAYSSQVAAEAQKNKCLIKTYTRYSEVADDKKRSKGAIVFLNSLKGAIKKKILGKPGIYSF